MADYGLEELVYELNSGARLARVAAADAMTAKTPEQPRFVAGALGPTNRRPRFRRMSTIRAFALSPSTIWSTAYREAGARLDRRRRRSAAGRNRLRHAELPRRRSSPSISMFEERAPHAGHGLGHDHRRQRPHPVGPDGRGVLELDRACRSAERRHQLRARRRGCAPIHRGTVADCRHPVSCHPNAGLPNEFGGYDETPEIWPQISASMRQRLAQYRRWLLRHHAGAYPGHRRSRAGLPPRRLPEVEPRCRA